MLICSKHVPQWSVVHRRRTLDQAYNEKYLSKIVGVYIIDKSCVKGNGAKRRLLLSGQNHWSVSIGEGSVTRYQGR